ncbi:MAG: PcfJ domain-containing protein, partial [Pseudomonadota bacterium]|nr:PcfJ domain-containing protein [Pseudomonadota bacterium]
PLHRRAPSHAARRTRGATRIDAHRRLVSEENPRITKTQRRAGWGWLVTQAERWRTALLAEQAHGKPYWQVPEPHLEGDYRFRVIGSFAELLAEGHAMHHCVFDYSFDCFIRKAHIVSIRRAGLHDWALSLDPAVAVDRLAKSRCGVDGEAAEAAAPVAGEGRDAPGRDPTRRRERVRKLVWFSIEYDATLVMDGFEECIRNAQVFSSVGVEGLRSVEELVQCVEWFDPVARVPSAVVESDGDALRAELSDGRLARGRRSLLPTILDAFENQMQRYVLFQWLSYRGESGLEACRRALTKWLGETPDPEDWEWLDSDAGSAQGAAKAWFERLDRDDLRQLGIRIVEGDHPSSSHHAAELRGSDEAANAAARTLRLGRRFR